MENSPMAVLCSAMHCNACSFMWVEGVAPGASGDIPASLCWLPWKTILWHSSALLQCYIGAIACIATIPCYIGASFLLQCYIGASALLQCHVTLFPVPCYNVKLVSVPCYNVLLFTVHCYNACSFMWVLLAGATPGIHRFLLLTATFCSLQCMCSFMWAAWVSCRGGTGSAGPGRQITERHVYHHPKHVCRVHWDTIQYKAIQYFQWVVGAVSDGII